MALPVVTQIKQMFISRIEDLDSVQKCYGAMVLNSDGFPAVYITPQSQEGEFSSNSENSRNLIFEAIVLMPVGSDWVDGETEAERMEFAEQIVAKVAEDISNVIDFDFELDGGSVLYTNAVDAEWGYLQAEFGWARSLSITLNVYTELTVVT